MFCILHITDLHRAVTDPISNAELISALVCDRERYLREEPPIAPPQAVVVSGDIIQGVGVGHPNFEAELTAQYEVAHSFLVELAERFFDGERARVIIVPGNHDIDWNRARASMVKVPPDAMPQALPRALHEPNSPYRWDWSSRELYIVEDKEGYRKRFDAFWRFFERFYQGATGLLRVAPWSDANLYSLDDGRIGVAAFNSCANNDCFAFHGEIPREVVARTHLDLQALGPWRLRIAVWHHDIEGPPHRSDYMDPDIVRGMIGRGFRLGLYGHQHRTQITPQHAYLPDQETMAVASAGSLCAGARELPPGARRGYSIIVISDDYQSARVHVREMAVSNLFSRAMLAEFGGSSFVDLNWTTPTDAGGRPENPVRDKFAATMQAAEAALVERNDPAEALRLLSFVDAARDQFGRRLLSGAAEAVGDWDLIIAITRVPWSIEELVLGVDACLHRSQCDEASALLDNHAGRLALPEAMLDEMRKRIELKRRIKS